MKKKLVVAEIIAVVVVVALLRSWFLLPAAPDAKALHEALQKIPLPPGSSEFRVVGDARDPSFSINATYQGKTVAELTDFYKAYFEENDWESQLSPDEARGGSLDYDKGRASMYVTTIKLGKEINLMVIYSKYAYTHEEFSALETESATPDALELIARVTKTYAELTSYRDKGTLEMVGDWGDPNHATFETVYVKPDQLRFSYAGAPESFHPSRFELAMKGGEIQTMADYNTVPETLNDISLALAGFYGVTSTTSGNIPELLMGKAVDSYIFNQINLTLLEEGDSVGGAPCIQLRGTNFIGQETTIWIGTKDYLIRKILSVTDAENQNTITYDPQANIEIEEEALAFRRP